MPPIENNAIDMSYVTKCYWIFVKRIVKIMNTIACQHKKL